ncbi:uncharacterized protein LOC143149186 [Ptiloglossa arizonensis]|uniref:uncharacterized protein LOC143149186 n=1 Tax=Ptiloglossa arizonensis TaxID=3350558 RepID=UPI003F9FD281
MIDRMIVPVLLGLLGLSYGLQCPKQQTSPGREVVCYTSVSDVGQLTNAICSCTTLVHQGYDVRNLSTSEFENFRKTLKRIHPPLQFMISVDDPGKTLRTSAIVRQEITARLIGILKEIDGVELNMTAGSKDRLLHFVKGLKDELVRKSYDKRIFMVVPTKPEDLAKQFQFKELSKYVDLFTVPTHYLVEDDEDYHTFHPSRLMGLFDIFNADSLIDLMSGLGAPKRKILVSVPASAYKFILKDQDDNAPRSSTEEMQPVIIDQKQLCNLMNTGEWTIERDEDLTAPYAFKNKTWVAFEDKISISIKGKYVLLRNLPGLAIRDVENDFETKCGKPLTHEIHHSFTDFKRKTRTAVLNALEDDLHQTELTYPTKVKSSDFRVTRVVDTEGHIRAVRENTQTEFTCSRQGYFVHPKSCNRFYRCVKFNQEVEDYSVFEFDCPAGLAFDERTEVCVWPGSLPQGSPCPGSSEIAPVAPVRFECPSKPGYYADPQNPRWFFACIDLGGPETMAYEFRCPFGLIFDEQKFVCEWPWLVAGYSGNDYTRSGYDHTGSSGQSTQATGGYFTGQLPHGYSGTTGFQNGIYTGTTAGVGYSNTGSIGTASGGYSQHSGFSGAAGVAYTGSTIGSHGSSFEQGSTGYSGTTGSGYSGTITGGHIGTGGYHGTTAGGHSGSASTSETGGSYGGSIDSGRTGSVNTGYVGSTSGVYTGSGLTGSAGTDYSGATGTGQISTGSGYVKTGDTVNVGTNGIYSGTAGTGYTGSTNIGGMSYTGSTGAHAGSTRGYAGSTDGGYSGSRGGVHAGSPGTSYTRGYVGSTSGAHVGSTGTSYTGGYADSSGGSYSGSTGGAPHSSSPGTGEYPGSTGGAHIGSTGYTGSSGGSYLGSTGDVHTGSPGTGYTGGYVGSTSGVHVGSTGTSYTGGYAGSSDGGYSGSTGGTLHSDSHGTGYTGGNAGSTSGGSGSGVYTRPTDTSYTGSATGGYSGSTNENHIDETGTKYTAPPIVSGGHSTGVYSGSGVNDGGYSGGSSSNQHTGSSYGSTVPGTQYTGSNYGGSQTGASSPGQIYPSAGPIGTGVTSGHVTGVPGQTFGTTYVQKPDGPTCDSCQETSQQPGDQSYITNGYASSHDVSTGSVNPGQSSIATTYFDNTGTKEHGSSGVSSGTTVYQGDRGYTTGFKGVGGSNDLNITLVGDHVPSVGSTTYHGVGAPSVGYGTTGTAGVGGIVTGSTAQGSIVTGDSSSGTVITYGDTPGIVVSGSSDQGAILTGSSYPGYITTGTGTPGYVSSGGVKTVYTGSASPGSTVYGTPSPGIQLTGKPEPGTILKGDTSPGVILTGQTAPGVSIGGSVDQGTVVDSTGHHTLPDTGYSQQGGVYTGFIHGMRHGNVPPTYNTGYKTNEYHDNGGRGTIRFNNGDVTTKYTENDIPDYRPAGSIPPDSIIPGHVGISSTLTPIGFTKTGFTRTGITTASLGGHGSYVISTGKTSPTTNPEHIGVKAFEGNVAGYTKTSTESSVKVYPGITSTQSQDLSHIDTSKITLGPSKPGTGYSYQVPTVQFDTGVTPASPGVPITSTEGNVLPATTPMPFLNVEIYNTPKFGSNELPTDSPAVVNTYTGGNIPSGFTSGPSPTVTPVIDTTGSLKNYKPTVQPVIDTGYKTVVSSTPIPLTVTHDGYGGNVQTGSAFTQTQFDFGTRTSQQDDYGKQNGYISSTPSSILGISSTYSATRPRPFGPSVSVPSVTEQPQVNYISSTSGSGYYDSTSKSSFEQTVTPSSIPGSLKPQTSYLPTDYNPPAIGVTYKKPFSQTDITYQQSTPVTLTGDSPTKVVIPKDEVGKLITNYNRGTTKYVPSQYDVYTPGLNAGVDFSRTQTSSLSTFGQNYGSPTPAPFGKTQSSLSNGYSIPSSVVSYQTTDKTTTVGRSKIIVKWSDLHPLLLGKLGAECTCKGDPFANLRGPGSRLINSSKGNVDLADYDDSDIYVDLERELSYENNDYVTNYESSSPQPIKIWTDETSAPSPLYSGASQIQEKPSSAYLPSVTPAAGFRGGLSGSSQRHLGSTSSRGLTANYRSGKSLKNDGPSINSVGNRGASLDRYGPGGLGDSEEILDGATNCARPGLFRHPNFCNKFYACHWDEWKKAFTLHVFNCPVHLTFDTGASACNWPSMGPACQDDNLLV